jgi:DNA-binding NarL/FixJ family response regulator
MHAMARSAQSDRPGPDPGVTDRAGTGLRVVLGEDDVLLREGLASLLAHSGFEVAGQAGNGPQLLALVREICPELVVTDMAEGRSNAGIARRLWVTSGTVEKHVRRIFTKLHLPKADDDHRRVLAVITFLEAR